MSSTTPRTWFITGASSGFGKELARQLVTRGDTVVGTFRGESGRAAFEAQAPGRAIGVLLDVTDHERALRAVQEIEQHHPVDVLVNNAGYGFEGAIEEASMAEVRQQFEVNVFGAVGMIQAVLPGMRARRRGHIVNVTSVGGLLAFPGVGVYNASKFALEGISEALAKEVGHLGIKVTAIEPGPFRTDWAGRSMVHAGRRIADYEESAGAFRAALEQRNGRQSGDPRKAAEAIIQAVEAETPPLHLVLGPGAFQLVGEKLGALQAELARWAPVSVNTDFPPGE